jgi:hypothetical protein
LVHKTLPETGHWLLYPKLLQWRSVPQESEFVGQIGQVIIIKRRFSNLFIKDIDGNSAIKSIIHSTIGFVTCPVTFTKSRALILSGSGESMLSITINFFGLLSFIAGSPKKLTLRWSETDTLALPG